MKLLPRVDKVKNVWKSRCYLDCTIQEVQQAQPTVKHLRSCTPQRCMECGTLTLSDLQMDLCKFSPLSVSMYAGMGTLQGSGSYTHTPIHYTLYDIAHSSMILQSLEIILIGKNPCAFYWRDIFYLGLLGNFQNMAKLPHN